jgi:hypothetical protein
MSYSPRSIETLIDIELRNHLLSMKLKRALCKSMLCFVWVLVYLQRHTCWFNYWISESMFNDSEYGIALLTSMALHWHQLVSDSLSSIYWSNCVASVCSQYVSDSIWHVLNLLLIVVWPLPTFREWVIPFDMCLTQMLMVVWPLPTFREWVIPFDMCLTCCWLLCGLCLLSVCKWFHLTCT